MFFPIDLSVLQCMVPDQEVGDYTIGIVVGNVGNAVWLTGVRKHTRMSRALKSVTPAEGSIHGGNIVTLSVIGGTRSTDAEITFGGARCDIVERTDFEVKCKVPPKGSSGAATVVFPGGFNPISYSYQDDKTPVISLVTPEEAGKF